VTEDGRTDKGADELQLQYLMSPLGGRIINTPCVINAAVYVWMNTTVQWLVISSVNVLHKKMP